MFELIQVLYGMFVVPFFAIIGLMLYYVGLVFLPLMVFFGLGWLFSLPFGRKP